MRDLEPRIGLTMRITSAMEYPETRDAIAQDWPRFLKEALPEATWLFIPNLGGRDAVKFCDQWKINRLIITGGDDIGTSDLRDDTEFSLLNWAFDSKYPVLGICRGMQLMAARAGISCKATKGHVATRHFVEGEINRKVNSFHSRGIFECPNNFNVVARANDGVIEAIKHESLPWLGWMWHPERECQVNKSDVTLFRDLFL